MAIATEQILVEVVADTSSLDTAIDQLLRMGAIDEKLATTFKKSNAEINAGAKAIRDMGSASSSSSKTLDDVAKGVKNISSGFAQNFKQGVISSLMQAGLSLEDFEQKLGSLSEGNIAMAQLAKSIFEIVDRIKSAGSELENLEASGQGGTEAFAKLEKQLNEDVVSLEKMTRQMAILRKSSNLNETTGSFVKLTKSIKETNTRIQDTAASLARLKREGGQGTEAFSKLEQQLKADREELQKMNAELDEVRKAAEVPPLIPPNTPEKIKTVRAELKELQNEIDRAVANNEDFGESFDALTVRAAHLKNALGDAAATTKNLGSDTQVFDGLIEGTQAVAGGFAVAQGAAALFGDESEAMQKTLLKVNAAMAILQGLQGIQNALQKESAAALLIANVQQKINNAQIALSTALESKNIVVRVAATVAQKALNLAMAASPIGIVAVALAGLILLLSTYGRSAAAAARETSNLNVALGAGQDAAQRRQEAAKQTGDLIVANLEREGAIQSKITKQEIENDKQQAAIEKENLDNLRKQKELNKNADLEQRQQLDAKIRELEEGQTNRQLSLQQKEADLRRTTDKEILDSRVATIEAELELAKEGSAKQLALQKQLIDARAKQELAAGGLVEGQQKLVQAKAQKEALDAQKAFNRAQLEQRISSVEAQLLLAQKGTEGELELQKKLLIAKANLDSNNTDSAAEKVRIATKLHQDLLEAEAEFERARIEIRIKGIENNLINVRAGSQEELNLRRKLLQEQAALELTNINLSAQQRKAVEEKLFADLLKLSKDDIKQRTDEELHARIDANNIILQKKEGTEAELRAIEIDNINATAQLEILAAEGNAVKIKAIKEKQAADILDINRQAAVAAAQLQFDNTVQDNQPERRRLQAILDFNKTNFAARKEAVDDLAQLDIDENIQAKHLLRQKLANKKISEEEYNLQYKALVDQRKQIDENNATDSIEIEREQAKRRLEIVMTSLHAISDVFTAIADAQNQKDEDRIAGMKKVLQDEIDAGAISEKEAKARQKRIDIEEKKAKTKAAERNKQMAIFNALIATAQAVASALASIPPNIPLSIIVGAMGLAQAAFIAARPIPKFKTGKKHLYEGFAEVAEDNQSEIIERKGGERYLADKKSIVWLGKQDKVFTHRETVKMLSEKNSTKDITKVLMPKPAYVVNKAAMVVHGKEDGWKEVKNELQALQKVLKNKNGVTVNVDKDGITEYFEKTMSEIHYFNSRYTFKNK